MSRGQLSGSFKCLRATLSKSKHHVYAYGATLQHFYCAKAAAAFTWGYYFAWKLERVVIKKGANKSSTIICACMNLFI